MMSNNGAGLPHAKLYIPASLSEIYDLLGSMMLWAPTFSDNSGFFPDRNIDSRFRQLVEGFEHVRKKLGEERYAASVDLAAQAKGLFADDPTDVNGSSDRGRKILLEIEEIIQSARSGRVRARLRDEEGDISGD